jgi:hypothetical protein
MGVGRKSVTPRKKYTNITLVNIFCSSFSPDAPTVSLSLGPSLNPENIAEGNDVYFECKISANPEVYKTVWLHNVSCLLHD